MKTCPSCGYTGTTIDDSYTNEEYCSDCGKAFPVEALVCDTCGGKLLAKKDVSYPGADCHLNDECNGILIASNEV